MHRVMSALVLAALASGCGASADSVTEPPSQGPPIERPRALSRVAETSAFALAGESALVTRVRGRKLEVRSLR